jgi:hypothetical protein
MKLKRIRRLDLRSVEVRVAEMIEAQVRAWKASVYWIAWDEITW